MSICLIGLLGLFLATDSSIKQDDVVILSHQEAVRDHESKSLRYEFLWEDTWKLSSEFSLLSTCHKSPNTELLVFYLSLGDRFLQLKRLETLEYEAAHWETMEHFWWTQPVPPHQKVPLIYVMKLLEGSGHFTEEFLYTLAELSSAKELDRASITPEIASEIIQDVDYLSPPAPFRVKLDKGKCFLRPAIATFSSKEMSFVHFIFNKDDNYHFPSGDQLTGTFKLVASPLVEPKMYGPVTVTAKYRIETDSFKRLQTEE